jgi:hypothetical protein
MEGVTSRVHVRMAQHAPVAEFRLVFRPRVSASMNHRLPLSAVTMRWAHVHASPLRRYPVLVYRAVEITQGRMLNDELPSSIRLIGALSKKIEIAIVQDLGEGCHLM